MRADGSRAPGPTVLYLGGFGRSGSTLLERLLAQDPDVAALGEVVHLWRRGVQRDELCGCGRPFSACPFWSEVGRRAFAGWSTLDLEALLADKASMDRQRRVPSLMLPWRSDRRCTDLARYAGRYAQVYRAAAEVAGTDVVVDASKHPSLAAILASQPQIDLRVVHLVRDSRGVAYSWSQEVTRPEVTEGQALMPQYSAAMSSAYWLGQNGLLHLLALRGVPMLRLRYEDLVRDPAAALVDVRRFAGLPDRAQAVREPGAQQHSVAGNPLRFATGPLVVRADERWRREMPAATQRRVAALTLPLALRYGYVGHRAQVGR